MKIKNTSRKIISVGETVILPGDVADVKGFDNNEAIKALVKHGDLEIVKTARGGN